MNELFHLLVLLPPPTHTASSAEARSHRLRIWNDRSLISHSSVYFKAAALIIKVALSGHLVSRGPSAALIHLWVFIYNDKL